MGVRIKEYKENVIREVIAPVAVQRVKQDINRWRRAIQEAETPTNPQRYLMQQMYLDTVLNGHVAACLERRTMNVLKKGLTVVDAQGNENEALTKIYNTKSTMQIVRYTLDARYYGYSLIQLGDMKDYKFSEIYPIRRSNINPEKEIVTQDFYSLEGVSVTDSEYADSLIWVKTAQDIGMAHDWGNCGYGLLYKVAPYEIWYKQAMTLWGEYQQLFGMPMRIGKTNTRDEQMRGQMADMLQNMGSAAWGVFDKEDDIDIINSVNTGGNQIYETMIVRIEKIISKLILGHADAMDSTAGSLGSSQGDDNPVHEAMEDIESFDCAFVEEELNMNILPKLEQMGFPKLGTNKLVFSNNSEKVEKRKKEDINNKVTADIVKVLFDAGFEADEKYITERTGIPVVKKEVVMPNVNGMNRMTELHNKLETLYKGECKHD